MGLDGTLYYLEVNGFGRHAKFDWWSEAPEAWKPLEEITALLLTLAGPTCSGYGIRRLVAACACRCWQLNADFKALWERIKHHTRYAIAYDSATLIEKAAQAIHDMPAVTTPRIISERASLSFDENGIQNDIQSVREHASSDVPVSVPDILGYLQHETELTRHTLVDILTQSGRLHDVLINPQQFLDEALKAIRGMLQQLMVDGVKYERIDDAEYEMQLFESRELEAYLSNLVKIDKSITDHIEFDSGVECNFAEKLDRMDNVKLFVKLPGWFRIATPVGSYNPDWAIVLECDEKLYLVRETRGATDTAQLRWSELARIKCGKAHFDELGVDYKHVSDADDLRCPK